MSKDLDVVLWMTHREYNGKPKLQDTINFVTVNVDLHAEFDCFKARMVSKGSSFVLVNEMAKPILLHVFIGVLLCANGWRLLCEAIRR